jgi:hypothetical protein
MTEILTKRVISLDPFEVQDETLAALESEIKSQANDDLPDIEQISSIVIDAKQDGGLDSHATIFLSLDGGDE